jgi:prepilin signal peptidase PulO-like enzyme (type II secretory pathway)
LFPIRCHPLQLTDNFQTLYTLASGAYNVYCKIALFPEIGIFTGIWEDRSRFFFKESYYSANI